MTTEFVYVKDDDFPIKTQPTEMEIFTSDAGRRMRWAKAFSEMGRASVGMPRPGDRVRGAEHEYNKKTYGEIYKKNEIVFRGINTTADHVLQSGYRIIGDDEEAQKKVREWAEYIELHKILYDVVRHEMIWGDCFMEVVDDPDGEWGIAELKLLHPHTMRVYVSETGDVIGYVQTPDSKRWRDPTDLSPRRYTTGRTQRKWKEEVKRANKDAIVFDYWEIVQLKWNSMPNSYYGTSTIEPMKNTLTTYVGMMQDMSAIIRRYASPMVVWRIGTPEIPASGAMMRDFERAMRGRNVGDDPVVPGIVDHEVLGAGQKAMDLDPYIQALRNDLFAGIAVPEVVLGGNAKGSSGGDEIKLEAFSRKIGEIQSQLSDAIRRRIFPRLLGITDGRKPISRKDWAKVPRLIFNPPETTEQRYLRASTLANSNIGTFEEIREILQMYPTTIPDGERAIDLQKDLAKETSAMRSAGLPGSTGPDKSSSRQRDKTAAQKPKTLPSPEHK
ncbi:MAG: hypothetical protein DRO11_05495 [Methanobacteriota archaeon]|nr:MAG: hypothetical protein DRO11_05495 [Euryarchaeota archaeon]